MHQRARASDDGLSRDVHDHKLLDHSGEAVTKAVRDAAEDGIFAGTTDDEGGQGRSASTSR